MAKCFSLLIFISSMLMAIALDVERVNIKSCASHICTDDYRPVCAMSRDGETTFGNQCMMDGANCGQKSLDKLCDGECPCQKTLAATSCGIKACPYDYSPVCAMSKDGETTFANQCIMDSENCGTKSFDKICDGECPCKKSDLARSTKSCGMIACPDNYSPICAMSKDGEKTFANQCMFDGANCGQKSFDKICDGECPCKKSELARPTTSCGIKACPFIYSPICAMSKDGEKTFDNQCVLDSVNCGQKSFDKICDGECPCKKSALARSCGEAPVCEEVYHPVCAKSNNGEKTFGNICMLDAANCEEHIFQKLCDGACPCKKIAPKVECNQICTMDYNPVCGMNKDGEKTFSNQCELNGANCLGKSFDKLCDGECPCVKKTPKSCESVACTREYRPICGLSKDGERTFANKCLFEFANCGQKSFDKLCDGECPCYLKSAPTKVCNNICTREYKPVCGMSKDGERTFANKCLFESANCLEKTFDKLCDGECPCYY